MKSGQTQKKGEVKMSRISNFDLVLERLHCCNDKCKSIVNDRDIGIIPRWIGGELKSPDLVVVGLNPGRCDTTERFLYKEYIKNDAKLIVRFTNHCLLDPGYQKNNFLYKLVELFKDIFGEDAFMKKIYITNLVKCESVINGVVDIETQEHCYEKFLQKEIELLQPKIILTLGNCVSEFFERHGVHNTVKCPHPSARGRYAKFWNKESKERQRLVRTIKEN